jgi:hypothetical protein
MAFTIATFSKLEVNADGRPVIVLRYTGNAGETPVEYSYVQDLVTMPTADFIRGQAMARLDVLNNNKNFVTGALPSVGTVLDTTTPLPTPPASTYGAFMAASAPFTPGATPQDVFTITGSTKRVTVNAIGVSTVQTTAGMNAWALVKRSTANTAGTSATIAGVPLEDAYPAATATVRQYTANPTAGTLIGTVWSGRVASPAPATALSGTEKLLTFNGSPVILTGTTDVLAWNLGGVALPAGLSVQAYVWWTEQ